MFNRAVTEADHRRILPGFEATSGSNDPHSIMRADIVTAKRKLLPDIEKLGTNPHAGLFGGILPSGVLASVTVAKLQLRDFGQIKLGATLPGE
jgi:hypothetical protein